MDGVPEGRLDRAEAVDRLADDVHDPAQDFGPDGDRDRAARVDRFHPPGQAFGRVHGHAADGVLADVLFDLDNDVDRRGRIEPLARDPDGGINFRNGLALEQNIHDGTDDLDDDAGAGRGCGLIHGVLRWIQDLSASTAVMISRSSLVMPAWRALFRLRVRTSISSSALLEAASMAIIRAACSAAWDSA